MVTVQFIFNKCLNKTLRSKTFQTDKCQDVFMRFRAHGTVWVCHKIELLALKGS